MTNLTLSTLEHSPYDEHAGYYVGVVDELLAQEGGLWQVIRQVFDERLSDLIREADVLDVACGEGHLARHLWRHHPTSLTAIDLSENLLTCARKRTSHPGIHYRHDYAQHLHTLPDQHVDVAVSNLAIMEIPDHRALFRAVRRVLRPGGRWMFSMMHPCFEHPHHPQFLEENGLRQGYVIRNYAREGRWRMWQARCAVSYGGTSPYAFHHLERPA